MKPLFAGLILIALPALPQGFREAGAPDLSDTRVQEIITKFAAKEAEFAKARELYTYRQTVRILDVDQGGRTVGKHEVVSDIIFSAAGKRTERVVRAPVPSLVNFGLEPEDEQDLRSVQPFVLTTAEIPYYDVRYLGKETLDEIPCYAFAVRPKKLEQGKRYFAGIAWVDDKDLQIVKTYGRAVGVRKKNSAYPKFETYREQIDGKFWFPTYTMANDTLHFEGGAAYIKMTVKYEDYKRFRADSTITFGDPVTGEGEKKPEEKKKP